MRYPEGLHRQTEGRRVGPGTGGRIGGGYSEGTEFLFGKMQRVLVMMVGTVAQECECT